MPRTGRLVVPGYPHHIIQRGHNRDTVFTSTADYSYYLNTLKEYKNRFAVRVYGYCLMTNHVHLLLCPVDNKGLGLLMKRLAGRQTRYRNRLEGRSGTLWDGRYRSSVVDTDNYLLTCLRYIELNPVRAGIVKDPADYPWSSYPCRIDQNRGIPLDPVPGLEEIETVGSSRALRYKDFIRQAIPEGEWDFIRSSVNRGQLTGSSRFESEILAMTGIRVERRLPGRPPGKKGSITGSGRD